MKKKKTVRDCALSLLEYRDRTEAELRKKLAEREYEASEIDEALDFLKEYHYVDDAEYTRRYIRAASSRKSIRRICQDLQMKGVEREILDLCLEEADVDEDTLIRACLQKKGYRAGEQMDTDLCRKVMASLVRKGFSFDAIRRVMNGMCENEDF